MLPEPSTKSTSENLSKCLEKKKNTFTSKNQNGSLNHTYVESQFSIKIEDFNSSNEYHQFVFEMVENAASDKLRYRNDSGQSSEHKSSSTQIFSEKILYSEGLHLCIEDFFGKNEVFEGEEPPPDRNPLETSGQNCKTMILDAFLQTKDWHELLVPVDVKACQEVQITMANSLGGYSEGLDCKWP